MADGDGPVDIGWLLKRFVDDAYDDEGRVYHEVIERMGTEMMERMVANVQNQLVRDWSKLTDLPFPGEVIARRDPVRRMQNQTKVRVALDRMDKLATKNRKKDGRILMEQLAIEMAAHSSQTKHREAVSVVLSPETVRHLDECYARDREHCSAPEPEPISTPAREGEPGPAPSGLSLLTPAPEAVSSQQPAESTHDKKEPPTPAKYLMPAREPPILEPRPIVKSVLCQEKLFKKLSGDGRKIPKLGRANAKHTKESYLLCTIIGYRGRECVYVEPVGTCGMYENEVRYLIIDSKSREKNFGGGADDFLDLPVTRDVRVYEVERISDVENPDVMSLLDGKPVWRVKSYGLSQTISVSKSTVFVEELHPKEHAVTVNGPWFSGPQYLHMGRREMPPLHSFLEGPAYPSDYKADAFLMRGALIYVKIPLETLDFCECCECVNSRSYFMVEPILLTDQQVENTNAQCLKNNKMSLKEFVRDMRIGMSVEGREGPPAGEKKRSKKKGKKGGRKNKIPTDHNNSSSPQVVTQFPMDEETNRALMNIRSTADLGVVSTILDRLAAARLSGNQPPLEVENPVPFSCDLCMMDIQRTHEIYYEIICWEDCYQFSHKKCMQRSFAGQGLRNKREYKEGVCLNRDCSARIQKIYEYSVTNEESLYLQCAAQPKVEEKAIVEVSPELDNQKENKEQTVDSTEDESPSLALMNRLIGWNAHIFGNQPTTEVAKPDPIKCSLCQTAIQPLDEVYFKVSCLEDCHLFLHKKCMQESLAGQGLRKKREYKGGICLTEGCAAHIQDIHEYSIMNKESLYLKCAEQPKVEKKPVVQVSPKLDKKKLKKGKNKEKTVESSPVAVPSVVQEGKESVAPEIPAPPPTTLPVVTADQGLVPSPKSNQSVPHAIASDEVVPVEKANSPVKDAVSEQPQKETKKKKKAASETEVGIRREQNQGTRDEAATSQNQLKEQEMKSRLSAANDWEELYNDISGPTDVASSSNQSNAIDAPRLPSTSLPNEKESNGNGFLDEVGSVVSNGSLPSGGNSNQLDDIVTSIDSCLQDLVVNTPSFKKGGFLPVSQLKEALFLVAGDRLNYRQKTYIEKIFYGAIADPESFRLFVSKLKYFSVSRMENNIIYCKNRAGRQLEEEQRSVSMDRSNGSDSEKVSVSVQTEPTKSYEELVRERDEARTEAEAARLDAEQARRDAGLARTEAEHRRLDAEAYRAVYMTSEVDAALRVCRSSLEHVGLIVDSLFPQNNSSLSPIISALLETKAKWIELENVQMERRRLIQSGQLNNLPPLPAVPVLPDVVCDFFQRKVVNEEKSHKQKNVAQPSAPPPGPVSPSIPSSMSTPPVNRPDRPVWGTVDGVHYRHVDLSLHECKICLDVIGNEGGNGVLSCPECVEPYHNQCVRGWLSTNSTCPQCRRNWPDPVDFPGLGEY